jgi:hypothetical protein
MVAAAVIGGAALTAGVGAIASNSASNKQQASANNATQAQLSMYNLTRGDLSPYNVQGQNALTSMNALMGGEGAARQQQILQNLPGYQFALNTGLKAVQNSAAARGLGSSGAALRGAADYATGLAQSNYGTYYNQLMGQATLGENAAAQTGANATQTGQSIGNNIIGAGNAAAAGALGIGNSVNNAINSGVSGYFTNQLLNQNVGGYNAGYNSAIAQSYAIGGANGPALIP